MSIILRHIANIMFCAFSSQTAVADNCHRDSTLVPLIIAVLHHIYAFLCVDSLAEEGSRNMKHGLATTDHTQLKPPHFTTSWQRLITWTSATTPLYMCYYMCQRNGDTDLLEVSLVEGTHSHVVLQSHVGGL